MLNVATYAAHILGTSQIDEVIKMPFVNGWSRALTVAKGFNSASSYC